MLFFLLINIFCSVGQVKLLFTAQRVVSDAYLVFMGLSFSLAAVGVTWAMFANLWGESLTSPQQKASFARGIAVLSNAGISVGRDAQTTCSWQLWQTHVRKGLALPQALQRRRREPVRAISPE